LRGYPSMVRGRKLVSSRRTVKFIVPESKDSYAEAILEKLINFAPEIIEKKIAENWMSWNTRADFLDPEIIFGEDLRQIVLSPIGMIHLYRQYFFEFETFLGPAVGHVWVSPGGTVELYEVTRKRTTTEREVRTTTELSVRRETSTNVQDDLSSMVKDDNSRDENLGVTVSSGGGFPGIFHADASLNYGVKTTNQHSEEVAHKHMRQQSEKLSSEMKRSFQTTFKTVVETEDITSKRHVLQNTTEELMNIELRRKMRRIGVQVQHIGTTLCWQVYIDEPGIDLGVANLVHMAKPADLSAIVPAEYPEPLKPIEQELAIEFPWMYVPNTTRTDLNKLYIDIGNGQARGDEQTLIFNTKEYTVGAPAYKYRLSPISIYSIERTGENLPLVDPVFDIIKQGHEQDSVGIGIFKITMKSINFGGNPKANIRVKLVWVPTDPYNQAAVDAQKEKYEAEKSRAEKEAYVNAIKERITDASKIDKRPSDDLRKEERIVVYRRLISLLLGSRDDPTKDRSTMHVISELIRTIFDVDKMLYFVAPDWWLPRERKSMQSVENADSNRGITLTRNDLVDWSSAQERDRDNYLITEDSDPAELGSSIGWVLELDGDQHRNAFLNSPWIKAVIPIQPGMETQAMNWLQSRQVEGNQGLNDEYLGDDKDDFEDLNGDNMITLEEVIRQLSEEVKLINTDPNNIEETEKVFEKGFDPLEDSFKWKGDQLKVFDQWTEILPTDQIVSIQYDPEEHIP
jgi:hypothetical protein